MAYRGRKSRGKRYGRGALSEGKKAMLVLGTLVGYGFSLWAYSEVLDAIWGTINTSTFFGATTAFMLVIIPVVGLVGVYKIIKPMFTNM